MEAIEEARNILNICAMANYTVGEYIGDRPKLADRECELLAKETIYSHIEIKAMFGILKI